MALIIRGPRNKKELEQCFDLRYRILRKPWNQPRGSERDGLEDVSFHIAAFDRGKVVGVARLHRMTPNTARVRQVAIEESCRKMGIGAALMKSIESKAAEWGCRRITANARDEAVAFYEKLGYKKLREVEKLFGIIRHFRMEKRL